MNWRVTNEHGDIIKRFPYQYQAIEFARDCLRQNMRVEVWYDSLLDGTPKRVMEII